MFASFDSLVFKTIGEWGLFSLNVLGFFIGFLLAGARRHPEKPFGFYAGEVRLSIGIMAVFGLCMLGFTKSTSVPFLAFITLALFLPEFFHLMLDFSYTVSWWSGIGTLLFGVLGWMSLDRVEELGWVSMAVLLNMAIGACTLLTVFMLLNTFLEWLNTRKTKNET